MRNLIWSGLAHVKPIDSQSVIDINKQAYVIVLSFAKSKADFHENIMIATSKINLLLIELEDEELYSERIQAYKVELKIMALVKEMKLDYKTKFGIFYTYGIE